MSPQGRGDDVVQLRPLGLDDADVLTSWAADPDFCREADWSTGLAAEEHRAFWRRTITAPPADLIRLGVTVEDGLVGYVDLYGTDPDRRELGVLIGERSRWGAGLGGRAARCALDVAFAELGLAEVWAEALDANQRSVRLLRRIGMRETGRGEAGVFRSEPSFYRRFSLRNPTPRP